MSKEPSVGFLTQLAIALRETEHKEVAEHFAAGFLWALYPDWFDGHFGKKPKIESALNAEYKKTFGQ